MGTRRLVVEAITPKPESEIQQTFIEYIVHTKHYCSAGRYKSQGSHGSHHADTHKTHPPRKQTKAFWNGTCEGGGYARWNTEKGLPQEGTLKLRQAQENAKIWL